jgi:heme-degrading monooxygenase HmoA
MPYTVSRTKVKDYDKWKQSYFQEDGIALRKAHGFRSGRHYRNSSDPNEIITVIEWDDLENARRLRQSNELQEMQKRGGVVEFVVYQEVEQF